MCSFLDADPTVGGSAFSDGTSPMATSPTPILVRRGAIVRWICPCEQRAILLGTIDRAGRVSLKVRDRYWHIYGGEIEAVCPKCGSRYRLRNPLTSPDLP